MSVSGVMGVAEGEFERDEVLVLDEEERDWRSIAENRRLIVSLLRLVV